jgi:hypothetical protein
MNELIHKIILNAIAQGMKPPFVLISKVPINISRFNGLIKMNQVLNIVPDGNIYLSEKKVSRNELKLA